MPSNSGPASLFFKEHRRLRSSRNEAKRPLPNSTVQERNSRSTNSNDRGGTHIPTSSQLKRIVPYHAIRRSNFLTSRSEIPREASGKPQFGEKPLFRKVIPPRIQPVRV